MYWLFDTFFLQSDQKDFESLKDIEINCLPKELQLLYKVSNNV